MRRKGFGYGITGEFPGLEFLFCSGFVMSLFKERVLGMVSQVSFQVLNSSSAAGLLCPCLRHQRSRVATAKMYSLMYSFSWEVMGSCFDILSMLGGRRADSHMKLASIVSAGADSHMKLASIVSAVTGVPLKVA
jgi:hypothetical protein